MKGKDPISLNFECGLRVWEMPRNLHAKRPATQCKAKQKIDNMLCNKLVAQLTTGHGVHVQGLDQANEDFNGGTLPLQKEKKKVKNFRGNACGVEDLSLKNESLRRISENNDWCVGRNEAGKLGKAEKQNPVRICHYNQPLRVRAVG